MAIVQQFKCDQCGAARQESNHWFVVVGDEAGLTVQRWNAEIAAQSDAKHICGPGCLSKIVDGWAE